MLLPEHEVPAHRHDLGMRRVRGRPIVDETVQVLTNDEEQRHVAVERGQYWKGDRRPRSWPPSARRRYAPLRRARRGRTRRAVHENEAAEIGASKLMDLRQRLDDTGRPYMKHDAVESEMMKEPLEVLAVLFEGRALLASGGPALPARVERERAIAADVSKCAIWCSNTRLDMTEPGTNTTGALPSPTAS